MMNFEDALSRYALAASALMTIMAGAWAAETELCPMTVTAEPQKMQWVAGEPIRVKVTFSNLQLATVTVPLAYPSLGGAGYPGINFSLFNVAPPRTDTPFANVGIETNIPIAQGTSWETHVYVNRYVTGLPIGRSTVYWRFSAACLTYPQALPAALTRSGSFDVDIRAANAAELQARANTYLAALDSETQTIRAEAVEALMNFTDPGVIPSLEQLYSSGYRTDALRALKKFEGDARAAQAIARILQGANAASVRTTLRTVSSWRNNLTADVVERLLANPDAAVRLALVDYLSIRDERAFDSKLTQLAADPDPVVVSAARRALEKRN